MSVVEGKWVATYAKLSIFLRVELAVRQKPSLVVLRAILGLEMAVSGAQMMSEIEHTHEDRLAHEREVLSTPEVAVVDTSHQYVSEEDTDVLVDLEPEGTEQTVAADKVPVEGPRE